MEKVEEIKWIHKKFDQVGGRIWAMVMAGRMTAKALVGQVCVFRCPRQSANTAVPVSIVGCCALRQGDPQEGCY